MAMLLGMAGATLAQADDTVARPSWSLRGFGSAGVAYSNNVDADYTASVLKGSGAGYSGRWSANVDSRLGAQLSVKVDRQWSAVLQVISEERLDNTYRPIVEWANVKYQATRDLSLRFGRIALPMFLGADYRKVGYAYTWARTPVEVYGAIPLTNSDGVDASYRWRLGGVKNVSQAFFGRTALKLPAGARIEARKLAGFSHTLEYGAFNARVSALTTELTVDVVHQFFDGLRQFGAQGQALADHYAVDRKRATAFSVGAVYDPGNWFAMSEIGRMKTRSFLSEITGAYASAGYRLGDFTPYLAYAHVRTDTGSGGQGLNLAGMPAPMAASGAALNGYLSWLLTTIPVQRTVSIGVRWDFMKDIALKVQFDQVTPLDGSRGTFINVQPGFRSGRSVHVGSAVLDFVF
jgi:hypothetical protein